MHSRHFVTRLIIYGSLKGEFTQKLKLLLIKPIRHSVIFGTQINIFFKIFIFAFMIGQIRTDRKCSGREIGVGLRKVLESYATRKAVGVDQMKIFFYEIYELSEPA